MCDLAKLAPKKTRNVKPRPKRNRSKKSKIEQQDEEEEREEEEEEEEVLEDWNGAGGSTQVVLQRGQIVGGKRSNEDYSVGAGKEDGRKRFRDA